MANKIIPPATDAPPITGRTIRVLIDEINLIKNGISSQLSDQDSTNKGLAASIQLLTERLGALQGILDSLNEFIAIDSSQVVSGVLADARIPVQSAAKISGGALSVGSVGVSGHTSTGTLGVSGDTTVSGHIYVPNSTLATSGYTVAYINGDGRLTRGASSRRFKKNIQDVSLTDVNLFATDVKEFEMIDGDGHVTVGYIAEELVGTDMERFVVFEQELNEEDGTWNLRLDEDGNPVPLSIDFIPLLMAQTRSVYEKQLELEARIAALES